MFSHLSVSHSVHRGWGCLADTPQADTPPGQTPPWADNPLGRHPQQTPRHRQPLPGRNPLGRHPPGREPPRGHCSRWYASYWNAFLFGTDFLLKTVWKWNWTWGELLSKSINEWSIKMLEYWVLKYHFLKQVCIPVGWVLPTCCLYLPACIVAGGGLLQVGCLLLEGVCYWGCLLRGVCSQGGLPLVLGGSASGPGGRYPSMHWGRQPPVNRMTDRQV